MRNRQMPVEGKIPPLAVVSPLRFSAIRHRLLLSLALAQGPLKLPLLAQRSRVSMEGAHHHAVRLREAGLLLDTHDGWRLRPGVVVGERYVGYLVPLDLTPKPRGLAVVSGG